MANVEWGFDLKYGIRLSPTQPKQGSKSVTKTLKPR